MAPSPTLPQYNRVLDVMFKRLLTAVSLLPGMAAVDLHPRADLRWSAIEAALGAALVGMSLLWFRRGRKNEPRDSVVADQADGSPADGQLPPPRIRGLLLLNLAPSEGRAEIETAPPLGPRRTVIDAIAAVAPGITFDGTGRGELAGGGHRLRLELGTDDPVAAVVAAAEGGTGVELLRTLMHRQGWRAYAPRSGRFIDPDGLDVFARADRRPPESML